MNKNYRIHTNISQDSVLNVNMRQDFDFLEVLSLQLSQEDSYRLHSSNYGVIIGRVLANDAFGIPNAKVSVFIAKEDGEDKSIEVLYPYASVTSQDKEGRRYNLLPSSSDDECYRVVGTFPSKTLVLDDNTNLEVYDKYYRYTTVTNQAGDYMIFGVPTGTNEIHVDIDLSDIGILSQKPRDFEYKGYNINLFDNPNQFKESTSLDSLAQIISQNKTVTVQPFWCDENEDVAAITRCDIEIQYKFEPTCVFMGSIMTDNGSNTIGHDCRPAKKNGMNNQLVTGEGTIEMIRKTSDGLVEEFQIRGNQLIDSDGVWCYQIPMNLDFIATDEYGNIIPTDNPSKGIPTRAQVRFRISKNEAPGGSAFHTAKFLVPMNPEFESGEVHPFVKIEKSGNEIEQMYQFGSATPQNCFRDLYWNNVYSVKSYIPRIQNRVRIPISDYSALKGANLADDQNQIPFNKLRVDVPFTYMIICILFTIVMYVVFFINTLICVIDGILKVIFKITDIKIWKWRPFKWIRNLLGLDYIGCMSLSAGMNDGNVAYYPGCSCSSTGLKKASCPADLGSGCRKSDSTKDLEDQVQRNLAQEYDIIKLDFYNDWLNGALYMPLWYWKRSKKKKFLFLTIKRAQDTFCNCNKIYKQLRNAMSCTIGYTNVDLTTNDSTLPENEKKWHKRPGAVRFKHGLIKEVQNKDGLNVYYYSAVDATAEADNPTMPIVERTSSFRAVRLYATDIILLGNLNEDNIYGIPQLFKNLPSTTANIPPIATTQEVADETDGYDDKNALNEDEAEGTITTTGMDWGHNGGGMVPKYKSGLFMDLSCTYVNTKAKACINAERLSEYGMNLDMSYSMPYSTGTDIKYGDILTDGFINKLEMDSMDERAMFATLNHNGFIPQAYQTQKKLYQTQVEDKNTNYLIPKFEYLYPVDLDGRMKPIMERYKDGFQQIMTDKANEDYITFRLGARSGETKASDGRSRHVYQDGGSFGKYVMPLYNNSFYFFFGINKGNTAIDKFNKLFDAQCFQNNRIPFTLAVDHQSEAVCPSSYSGSSEPCPFDRTSLLNLAYPYIRVTVDDIETPFAYTLYDASGKIIITEGNMTDDDKDFVIGGTLDVSGNVIVDYDCDAKTPYITWQKSDEMLMVDGRHVTLKTQVYKLMVTDANGRSVVERVDMGYQSLVFDYTSQGLGMKYQGFDEDSGKKEEITPMESVCEGYNGKIVLQSVTIDGYDLNLSATTIAGTDNVSVTIDGGVMKLLNISGTTKINTDGGTGSLGKDLIIELAVYVSADVDEMDKCMCKHGSPLIEDVTYDAATSAITIGVYRPGTYTVTFKQMCDSVETNDSMTNIYIPNGKNFTMMVNTVPLQFMIGTTSNLTQSKGNHFYAPYSGNVQSVYDSSGGIETSISGWLHPDNENNYKFPRPNDANEAVWEDFVKIEEMVGSYSTKRAIIAKKFEWLFKLSEAIFTTTTSSMRFTMSSVGGVQPVLYRTVHPDYTETHADDAAYSKYLVEDMNSINGTTSMPSIIGSNYCRMIFTEWDLPTRVEQNNVSGFSFNTLLFDEYSRYVGNYMAAFTNDAGYSSTTGVRSDAIYERAPWVAKPNPSNYNVKIKGRTMKYEDPVHPDEVNYVYKVGQEYIRGLFVDRRFDYDLVMLGPMNVDNFSFKPISWDEYTAAWRTEHGYTSDDEKAREAFRRYYNKKENPWGNARLFGTTYNGIEMAYDDNYNLISAGTRTQTYNDGSTTMIVGVPDSTLEYTFDIDSGTTRLNISPTLLAGRRPYEAFVNSFDLLNKDSANHPDWAIENVPPKFQANPLLNNYYRLIKDESGKTDYAENVYPTRRELNVFLPPTSMYVFSNVGCSYDIKPEVNEDGNVYAYAEPGENTEIEMQFTNLITFLSQSTTSEDWKDGDIRMYPTQISENVFKMEIEKVNLRLKVGERSSDDFTVYIYVPRIMPVHYMQDGVDHYGVEELKSIATTSGTIKTNLELTRWIESNTQEFDAKNTGNSSRGHGIGPPELRRDGNHNEIGLNWGDLWIMWDDDVHEYAACDNSYFKQTEFTYEIAIPKKADVFSILLDEIWFYNDPDCLKRCLRVVEMSEPYDLRPLKFEVIPGSTREEGESPDLDDPTVMLTKVTTSLRFQVSVNPDTDTPNQTFTNMENLKVFAWFHSSSRNINFRAPGMVEDTTYSADGTSTAKFVISIDESLYDTYGYDMVEDMWHDNGGNKAIISIYVQTNSGLTYQLGDFSVKTPTVSGKNLTVKLAKA